MAASEPTTDLAQHASVAGELAPNLWGRTDFEKYDSAWAEAKNWIVDYRGGLFTRSGFEFGDVIPWTAGNNVKLVPFQFSPDTSNTYTCVFTNSVVRFIQDNAWVLEAAKTVASVANGAANKIVMTSNAHGFANGDYIKLSGFTDATLLYLNTRTIVAANITANTFDIADAITGSLITKASIGTSAGSASRVYTVASPYTDAQLTELRAEQIRDTIRLTHPDFPVKNLTRTAHASWAIANTSHATTQAPPTALATTASSGSDSRGFVYKVTAVSLSGEESLPATIADGALANIMNSTDSHNTITWTAAAGAVQYRIYRSRDVVRTAVDGDTLMPDIPVGFIGTCTGVKFVDGGITPDFTQTPHKAYDPFANGRIEYVTVSVAGTGYEWDGTITWPTGGSLASGYLAVENDGASPVRGVVVVNGGKDYTGTTVTAAGGGGDATMTATLSAASGNYPACSTLFQQRQYYAATDNYPIRLFATRPGQLANFDYSEVAADDDSQEFDLDTDEVAPIRHLVSMRGGIAAFSQVGVWIVSGRDDQALTANNAQATLQNTVGASLTKPVLIDSQILYAADAGQELRLLIYDDYNRIFQATNVSVLSNHLFAPAITINQICWAQAPYKLAFAVQSNGRLVSLALDTQNGVFGMTPQWTQGYFKGCVSIEESAEDRLYVAVERYIQSTRCLFFERLKSRNFARLEESFCVDAGLSLAKTAPSGRLQPSTLTGAVTFTVTGATPFVSGDVGKILRCGEGKATITGCTSSTIITGTWTRDLSSTLDVRPETSTAKAFDTGYWWLDSTATTIRGMWHLIGQTYAGLADGAIVTGTVDSDGIVTLAAAASRLHLGLSYTCQAKTLPPTVADAVIEGRQKDISGVKFRVNDTYGLKVGGASDDTRAVADRANRLWSSAAAFRNEIIDEKVRSAWSTDQPVYFVQSDPLPACILAFVRDMSLGDDKS